MDERSGKDWSKIVDARDGEIAALAGMLCDLRKPRRKTYVFVIVTAQVAAAKRTAT